MIDSHCHIDMPQFDADRDEVVARARAAGLVEMLVVGGVDESAGHRRALERGGAATAFPPRPASTRTRPASADEAVYDELRGLARDGRIVAIGEIGLDFHYDHSPRDAQREVFRRQIRLARDVGLPIVVHTREADERDGRHPGAGGRRARPAASSTASRAASSWRGGRSTSGFLISFSGHRRLPAGGGHPAGGPGGARRTGCSSRRTRPSWRRRRTAGSGTSRPSWSRWRARWRRCGARPPRRSAKPRPAQLRAPLPAPALARRGRLTTRRESVTLAAGVAACDASPQSTEAIPPWPTARSTS